VIPFFAIASSLRQYLAFSIMLYMIIQYFTSENNRYKSQKIIFSAIISCCIHPSAILLLGVFFVSKLIRLNKTILYLIILVLILNHDGLISSLLFQLIRPLLESLGFYFPEYMDSVTIGISNSLLSTNEYILNKIILPSVFFIFTFIYLILFNKKMTRQESQIKNFCSLLLLLICLLSLSPDLFYRFSIFW
ncbi:TPA: O11 family O-antigen polymerase, partial [Escherichia coli]|nr:O11 family O-antigen polymerase [Escherichia coli]